MVELQTNMGDIVIELNEVAAPLAVKNFLTYVEEGFYNGTIFHRVISGFMIQAGGIKPDMSAKRPTRTPIVNEASNGLKNNRGTVAMGQVPGNPDSATTHFFINHRNNDPLNYVAGRNPGYTVFGKVVSGMDVVDKIAGVQTTVRMDLRMEDIPVKPVIIESAKVVSQ
ncbi:MAG: peptidylprolyl isomerase [Planctomycetota bacterium]